LEINAAKGDTAETIAIAGGIKICLGQSINKRQKVDVGAMKLRPVAAGRYAWAENPMGASIPCRGVPPHLFVLMNGLV